MAQANPFDQFDDIEPFQPPQQPMGVGKASSVAPVPATTNVNAFDQFENVTPAVDQPYKLDFNRPTDPTGEGDIGFASQASAEANSLPAGAQEFQRDLQDLLGAGVFGDPGSIRRYARVRGFDISDEQAQAAFDAVQSGQGVSVATPTFRAPDISDVRGEGGIGESVDAAGRGIANIAGLDDEIGAIVDSVTRGGSLRENLARNRAIRDYDEDENFWARTAGTLGAGLLLPSGVANEARAAAVQALRSGLGREAAISAARRAAVTQLAKEGGAVGAAHGAGAADGNLGDRALGALVEAPLGAAAGAGIGAVGSRFLGPGAASAAERNAPSDAYRVAQAAERQNIDILPQDVAGAGIGRATAGAAQTTFGSPVVSRATGRLVQSFDDRVGELAEGALSPIEAGQMVAGREAQAAARSAAAAERTSRSVMDNLGAPVDATGAGQLAQRGVARWMDDTAERASKLYDAIPIADERSAVVSNTRQKLADLTAAMESNPKLSALFDSPRLRAYLTALTPEKVEIPQPPKQLPGGAPIKQPPIVREEGGQLSWRDLMEFRTRVGDMLDEPRLSEKIAPRQLRELYSALSKDMEATARAEGPDALKSWKRANNYYDGRMKRINDTLSMIVGERKDKTANEAFSALENALKIGPGGNSAAFERVMRSLPPEDANVIRSTIVDAARGRKFDAEQFAKNWSKLSERGKSSLLPRTGMRDLMDDAAARAETASRSPFAGKSPGQVYDSIEQMARNKGDVARFNATLNRLSPEEASSVRATIIDRLGRANDGAQNAAGDTFSISQFLTNWNRMTREAKDVLFGSAGMRRDMDDLALIAERVKASARLAGHSNTGAVNNFNATTGGLGGAVVALLTGHPLVAAGLAAPAAYQRISAEILTSPRLLSWLARAPKKPNVAAQRAHVAALSGIAKSEPAIAADVTELQRMLQRALTQSPAPRAAGQENKDVRSEPPEQERQP